jgi:SET domain-containing protein
MSDMINHRSEPNVEITWDNDGNVNVIFVKDVQAGEQLFKCYGRKFPYLAI